MNKSDKFKDYPEKLNSASVKDLQEWLRYWNIQVESRTGGDRKTAIKEKAVVEKLLAEKKRKIPSSDSNKTN
jgi:hypothetical protein